VGIRCTSDWATNRSLDTLCSFGGAYSNHLHALAAFGHISGTKTIGVIRGQQPRKLSPTLVDLQAMGMRLIFEERKNYKRHSEPEYRKQLEDTLGVTSSAYWIPEGGGGERGQRGCIELGVLLAAMPYDFILLASGTGTTFQGVLTGLNQVQTKKGSKGSKIIAVSALRNSFELAKQVSNLAVSNKNSKVGWALSNQYHFGGFAKSNEKLMRFMHDFTCETSVPLEKVYTGKLFYGLSKMIISGEIPSGSRVLAIHSGGLQGNRALLYKE